MIYKQVNCISLSELCNRQNGTCSTKVTIEFPSTCPHCNKSLNPVFLSAYYSEALPGLSPNKIHAFFFCPSCEQCFQVYYCSRDFHGTYNISFAIPTTSNKIKFSENINNLSPSFSEIYNQAYLAEQSGLNEICGLGYRKSLEFLVKDYAIHLNPEDKEVIKSSKLFQCIQKYIESKKIKTLATACAWIGNDETHYVRKHENYGIDQLKAFISSVVSFIDSDLSYEEALSFISKE